jgi:DNA-binding MarR family transcriptional regulator
MSSAKQFKEHLNAWVEVVMRHSMRDLMQFVKNSDLSMAQYSTLMRLHYHGACGVSDVGTHLGVTNAAASQLVDRLVQVGLVERAEDPHDRRAKHLTLTAKGRALIQHSFEARLGWTEALAHSLTADQRDALMRALRDLTLAAQSRLE